MSPTLSRLANAARQIPLSKGAANAKPILPTYPIIQKCPSPTCQVAEMPADLDIERQKPLNGTMVAHSEQMLIASGQADWASKIEDEGDKAPWSELAINVKNILGKGGEYHDPYHRVGVHACSFQEPPNSKTNGQARAFLFPSFRMIDQISTEPKTVADFVKTFLLPQKLSAQHDSLSDEEKRRRTRDMENAKSPQWAGKVRPINTPTIMICSHNTRDSRCGVLGPLLHAEFSQYINKRHTLRNHALPQGSSQGSVVSTGSHTRTFTSHPEFRPEIVDDGKDGMHPINVGMISHVGGHAWAGNVIVYIPPEYLCKPVDRVARGAKPKDLVDGPEEELVSEEYRGDEIIDQAKSPLAGKTVWYGRVEPKHVEGIVEQTIGHGRIIEELFRGGVNADGSILRI